MSLPRSRFLSGLTCVLAVLYLLSSGLAHAVIPAPRAVPAHRAVPPPSPERGEIRWVFGVMPPMSLNRDASNALFIVRVISNGLYGYTQVVRPFGPGFDACGRACVRKVSAITNPRTGFRHDWVKRFEALLEAQNEADQHRALQRTFDATGDGDPFFPRILADKKRSWPAPWPQESSPSLSAENFQQLIQGNSMAKLVNLPGLPKADALALGVYYLQSIIPKLELISTWTPPFTHNDLHINNILVGWIGQQLPPPDQRNLATMRAYMIDMGEMKAEAPRVPVFNIRDLVRITMTLYHILHIAGIRPESVTLSKFSLPFRSKAEVTVRQSYAFLRQLWDNMPGSSGMHDIVVTNPKITTAQIFAQLKKYREGVQPEFSSLLQLKFKMTGPDPGAEEPVNFATKDEMLEYAVEHKVAGPWWPAQAKRQGGSWRVVRFYAEEWCDWNDCMPSAPNPTGQVRVK